MRKTKGLALLLPFALALAARPGAAVTVTAYDVTVTPRSSTDRPCPVTFTFHGKVGLSKQGQFTYRWERSDGVRDTEIHAPVVYDGSHAALLSKEWRLGERSPAFHPYRGWMKLHILTPENRISRPAEFTLDCGAPLPTLPPGAIARPTVPDGAAPHVK